jgi:multicomponent Na+:H+ antiporter subunit D
MPFADLYAAPPYLLAHAPVLMVMAPLIAACVAALAPGARWAWSVSVVGSVFAFWMALACAGLVAREGVIEYAMGGFAPPVGITLRIDALGVLFALLISGISVLTALFSGHGLIAEVRSVKHGLFQAGYLLCVAGLLGMSATGDAFNAFVFLEVSSIGTYALIAAGERRDRRALPAAFNYLVMGTIGASLFVIGVGFLYAASGTLNIADMAQRLAGQQDSTVVQAGFALIVVGLGLKAAIFPLHGWLPNAYAYAPSLMAAFLAATATKAAIYLIIRFTFTVFDHEDMMVSHLLEWVIMPVSLAAILICSVQAIYQGEVRRILAFSSVAQVGYIMAGVALGTAAGLSAGLLHLINHSLMKAALFMALGAAAISIRGRKLSDLAGAGRSAPFTMTAFAIGALSLMGVPLTGGFLSKWRLVESALAAQNFLLVAAIAAASILALIYCGRMLETVFFRAAPADAQKVKEAPLGVLVPLWLLAFGTIWFGVDASIPEALAEWGARAAMGGVP